MDDEDYRMAIHAELDRVGTPGVTTINRVKLLVAGYERLYEESQARAKRSSRERLLAQLDEDRSELLLLIADACLDEAAAVIQDEARSARLEREARAWGWLAQHRKWPARTRMGWAWGYREQDDKSELSSFELPIELHMALDRATPKRWPACSAALEVVVQAIAEGKWKSAKEK